MKTYNELLTIDNFHERLQYLRLGNTVGLLNKQVDAYFAHEFYRSPEWKKVRTQVLVRDNFCDLAIPGLMIDKNHLVHHIEPLTWDDLSSGNYDKMFGLQNLVTCCVHTHNMIHYGHKELTLVERKPDDHIPWKKGDSF